MTPQGWITLAIILVAAIILISEKLRPDLTALFVVLALSLTGVITTEQALSGFSQAAVITILSIFILTHGLERTGVTRWIGRQMLRLAGDSERRLIATLAITSALLASFMNNIAAAAVLLPTAMGVARQTNIRPSRLLMPLAFGSMLGGTTTLLATANIIVSTTLDQAGLAPFGVFEFLPIGIPMVLCGTWLMYWLAPKLLPDRDVAGEIMRMRRLQHELAQVYHLREGTAEVVVKQGSAMAGKSLHQAGWGEEFGLSVLGISHKDHVRLAPGRDAFVEPGDILLLDQTPTPEQLERCGLRLTFEADLLSSLSTDAIPLAEVILAPRSHLEGRTLKEIHFRERYGLQVIALWRQGIVLQKDIADIPLRFGDAMLVQGLRERLHLLRMDPEFLVLEEEIEEPLGLKALLASGILIASIALAALQILPIAIAVLAGAALMVLTGCLSMDQAYRAVEWRAIFLIAGMIPLSIALDTTGTAAVLGSGLYQLTGGLMPLVTGGLLVTVAAGLSLFLSSQTAAVIMAPVAIAAAAPLGVDPRALAMAVAIGCALSFTSPVGHPSNLLVMGPGGYTFRDYLRLGIPLTLIAILVALLGLHWVWGL
jgi:di/tricarboxylate transporter